MVWHDVLIIGRGIAGNTLALTLLEKGLSIKVADLPNAFSPSRIAPGLFNPFTGKKNSKTWLAEELFPFLHDFYKRIEAKSEQAFFHERAIYRPFLSITDYNDWTGKIKDKDYSYFLNDQVRHEKYSPFIHNPLGGIECKRSGHLDTKVYLKTGEKILLEKNILLEKEFHYKDLSFSEEGLVWSGMRFKNIVFCEGIKALENPFFPKLPLIPNKGEVLTLSIENFPLKEIVSQGVFLVEKSPGLFQAGSTYRWVFDHADPEPQGALEIQEKLNKWLKAPYRQTNIQAGIRPASKDRRPLIGSLEKNPAVLIFNGLGTKGVSLAPYWAEQLAQHLIFQKDLPEEVNIRRFYVN